MPELIEKFIKEISDLGILSAREYLSIQRKYSKEYKMPFFQKDDLVRAYQKMIASKMIDENKKVANLFQMKNTRSQSGIVVVSVLTRPYSCSGKCIYCPTEPNVPKSYLSNEPAVMRAIMCKYHPYKQVNARLNALKDTGHIIDKISIRLIGGTWSQYPAKYQTWYIKELFKACNEFNEKKSFSTTLSSVQEENMSAPCRIVEMSIETRQDEINLKEILKLRKYGVTKVELGVQSVDDVILDMNNRGNNNQDTIAATKMLKDYGFKVSYQMMLNLYGSDYEKDLNNFIKIFSDQVYKPDHLKIYPLALVKNCELYKLYQEKKFIPYSKEVLINLISEIKKYIPRYCRIERVIRDIPATEIIEGGAMISNLRQEVGKKLKDLNIECKCIRCREIKRDNPAGGREIFIDRYFASGAEEYFISLETIDRKYLIGFCRLRLVVDNLKISAIDKSAIIREIHVYGPTVAIGKNDNDAQQHHGVGKELLLYAEKIAKERNYKKIAVIAGVGVRGYFKKMGYALKQSYMVKNFAK